MDLSAEAIKIALSWQALNSEQDREQVRLFLEHQVLLEQRMARRKQRDESGDENGGGGNDSSRSRRLRIAKS
jgi:hypothetical protein